MGIMNKKELIHIINTYQNYINDFVNISDKDLLIILDRLKENPANNIIVCESCGEVVK